MTTSARRIAEIAGVETPWSLAVAQRLRGQGWRIAAGPAAGASLLVWSAPPLAPDDALGPEAAAWDRTVELSLKAPFHAVRAFAAGLGAAQGDVVFLLDRDAWDPAPDGFSRSVATRTLWALARGLAVSLGPSVRVNALGLPAAGRGLTEALDRTLRYVLSARAVTGQLVAIGEERPAPPVWGP